MKISGKTSGQKSVPARPKVLVVDDEEEILVALTDLLEEEYEVLAESNPLKALELLRGQPDVAVIISDQRMPEMPGDRFLSRARTISDARSLLLTGYADLDAVVSALNEGKVQAYIHKPWEEKGLRALVAEVAQHCLSQRALRTEQALLHGLMEALPFGLVFSDAEGRCIRSNVEVSPETEASVERNHYPPELRSEVEKLRAETRQNGHAESTFSIQEQGAARWHEMTRWALAWPPKAGTQDAWQVSMDRDVTRRMTVEARLRQAERLESLGTLAGGIAHDFNNLLAAISGALDMLEDDVPPQTEGRVLLEQAQEGVQRGAAMTRRLLQFGRQGEDCLVPVAPGAFIEGLKPLLVQSLHGTARCQLEMQIEGKDGLPSMLTDARQLEMALLNLCVNARDAMPKGGRVWLTVRCVEVALPEAPSGCAATQALAIEVRDEGTGISPEIQTRVFDPFFTTKPVGKGTGLGLSGVYGFMARTHGQVKLESTLGKGTSVTLLVPVLLPEAQEKTSLHKERTLDAIEGPGKPQTDVEHESVSRSGLFADGAVMEGVPVLIMDDEAPVRQVVGQFLRHEGAETRETGTLEEAFAFLETGFRPALALLDVRMPEHNGPDCARALRRMLPDLKILYMSGETAGAALAGERLLSKPFTQLQLRLALGEMFGVGRQES